MEEEAAHAGSVWAMDVRDALVADGRRAAGGWPGTMTEARARADGLSGKALAPEERHRLGRIVYAAARVAWGATASRE